MILICKQEVYIQMLIQYFSLLLSHLNHAIIWILVIFTQKILALHLQFLNFLKHFKNKLDLLYEALWKILLIIL